MQVGQRAWSSSATRARTREPAPLLLLTGTSHYRSAPSRPPHQVHAVCKFCPGPRQRYLARERD